MKARRARLWAAIAVPALLIVGCGGGDGGGGSAAADEASGDEEFISFNLGSAETLNFAPIHVALERGIFASHGLDPTTVTVAGGAEFRAALQSGDIDLGVTASTAQPIAVAGGIDLETFVVSEGDATIATYDVGAGILARTDSGIDPDDPSTFVGTTVGAGFGGTVETYLRAYLDDNGVDQGSVDIINVPIPESVDALVNGLVDAVSTTEPHVARALENDGVQLVSQREGYVHQVMTVGAPPALIEENPELLRRFTAAMTEASHWVRNNREEAASIVTDYVPGLEEQVALAVLEGATFDPRISVCTEETFTAEAAAAFAEGRIPVDISDREPLAAEFIEEVEAENPEWFEDLPPVPTSAEGC